MDELRRRFASLDHLRAPDLWDEIELRAAALGSTERLTHTPVPMPVRSRGLSGGSAVVLLVAAALLVALVAGAVAVGSGLLRLSVDRDLVEPERALVEPFIGLPPAGAATSTPEDGQLVLSVYGRMEITRDVHGIWVYADGRVIWRRSLDAHVTAEASRHGFGASGPTRAVIEQRLTPEGVELLRSEVINAGLAGLEAERECGGPVYWAHIAVWVGDRLMRGAWCDRELPGRLADFASWLPASAWADQRIGGYVPSRYAVCIGPWEERARVIDQLPESIRSVLEPYASLGMWPDTTPSCSNQVTTHNARAIAAMLDDAGFERSFFDSNRVLGYTIPLDQGLRDGYVFFDPILPNGDVVEYGQ